MFIIKEMGLLQERLFILYRSITLLVAPRDWHNLIFRFEPAHEYPFILLLFLFLIGNKKKEMLHSAKMNWTPRIFYVLHPIPVLHHHVCAI